MHVLIHRHEQRKPSSTGTLVARAVVGTTQHVFQRENRFFPASGWPGDAVTASQELWILHPSGEPLPASPGQAEAARAARTHVLLLDGTWPQAGEMLRSLEGVGRSVRLPDAIDESSRYWLRDQPGPSQLSTAEALIGILRTIGDRDAERLLRLHFELHVYATLRARGKREMAERYLGHSPLLIEAPEALDRLHARVAGI